MNELKESYNATHDDTLNEGDLNFTLLLKRFSHDCVNSTNEYT